MSDAAVKNTGVMLVSVDQLALVLMVTGVWVRRLCREGYIPAPVKGKIPLIAGVQGYIRWLKDEDRRSSKTAADSRVRDARAREIEQRMAREEGELIPTEEGVAYAQAVVGALISRMNGLPAQITRDLDERRRIEAMLDHIREEVAAISAEHGPAYRSVPDTDPADAQDKPDRLGEGEPAL